MTSTRHANGQKSKSPEELRAEVERARSALGDTVGELAAKADVKAAARQKTAEYKARARQAAEKGRQNRGTVIGATAGVVGAAGLAAVAVMMMKRRRGGEAPLRMSQARMHQLRGQARRPQARMHQLRGQARLQQARMQQLQMKRHGMKALGMKQSGMKQSGMKQSGISLPGMKGRSAGPLGISRRKGVRAPWARSSTSC